MLPAHSRRRIGGLFDLIDSLPLLGAKVSIHSNSCLRGHNGIRQEAGESSKRNSYAPEMSLPDAFFHTRNKPTTIVTMMMPTALFITIFGALVTFAGAEQASVYINAEAINAYTDSKGTLWQADDYYNTGSTFRDLYWIFNTNNEQEGTSDRVLYRSSRYDSDPAPPNLIYNITGK